MPLDAALAHTAPSRAKASRLASRLIAANDNTPPKPRIRYRGTRPAWNWLAKQDKRAAAALWLVARQMLPAASNDNHEPGLTNIDRRKDGKPRGPDEPDFDAESYLALPAVLPRFGDAPPTESELRGWHSDGLTIKRQRQPDDFPLYPFGRFVRCRPGVAWHYGSMVEPVGKSRPGVSRGDARRVDLPELPDIPDRTFLVIETMLAGGTLAAIGEALGYHGGYMDRAGRRAMRDAGTWAQSLAA